MYDVWLMIFILSLVVADVSSQLESLKLLENRL